MSENRRGDFFDSHCISTLPWQSEWYYTSCPTTPLPERDKPLSRHPYSRQRLSCVEQTFPLLTVVFGGCR